MFKIRWEKKKRKAPFSEMLSVTKKNRIDEALICSHRLPGCCTSALSLHGPNCVVLGKVGLLLGCLEFLQGVAKGEVGIINHCCGAALLGWVYPFIPIFSLFPEGSSSSFASWMIAGCLHL